MTQARILIVEDEANLAETLKLNLRLAGYEPSVASTGSAASSIIERQIASLDLIILDVMLPEIDGYELCRQVRKKSESIPVLFLTARSDKASTIEGLKLGADDYLSKPFDLDELLLRIKNLLKRKSDSPGATRLRFGPCEINFGTFEIVAVDGSRHTLSRREIGLLRMLTSSPGKVVSRDEILSKLWEEDENASARTIDNYILGFRKYFEANPRKPRHFHTIRGVGYKFIIG